MIMIVNLVCAARKRRISLPNSASNWRLCREYCGTSMHSVNHSMQSLRRELSTQYWNSLPPEAYSTIDWATWSNRLKIWLIISRFPAVRPSLFRVFSGINLGGKDSLRSGLTIDQDACNECAPVLICNIERYPRSTLLGLTKRHQQAPGPFDNVQQNARLGYVTYAAQRPTILFGRIVRP